MYVILYSMVPTTISHKGDTNMNARFCQFCLKINQLDSRHIRLAWLAVALLLSGRVILGIPIGGDVGG